MQVIDSAEDIPNLGRPHLNEPDLDGIFPEIPEAAPVDRGIEFEVDSLPFAMQGSALSELRSGTIHLKGDELRIDGRDTVPDYLRAKLYTLGSCFFLPGLAMAFYLIESVSWIPSAFTLTSDDVLAYTFNDHYHIISVLFNRTRNNNAGARRTLTFQLPQTQYQRVKTALAETYPDKLTQAHLAPANAAGSSAAAIGIIIWTLFIVGTAIWRPWTSICARNLDRLCYANLRNSRRLDTPHGQNANRHSAHLFLYACRSHSTDQSRCD